MMRILFVDDEPLLLDGLRAGLRRDRHRWEMFFAESAEEALGVMAEQPVDILVTDVRMPGMDGAELLARAREAHPATARIVLSGQADEPTARRLVNLAHQCLAKPARPEDLRTVLERTSWLRDLLDDERLREAVGGVDQLPVLPTVYAGVSRLAEDPGSAAHDVAEIIATDPGLCAKVMQIANSAFFGRARPIADIDEAVVFLGITTMRYLVLSLEVLDAFERAPAAARPVLAGVQRRALATGNLARRMAFSAPGVAPDDAFLSGVLHDVGLLVLAATTDADAVSRICAAHAEVGGYLLGLWGLAPVVVEAVAHHHSPVPPASEGIDLGLIVHVAQALVWERTAPTLVCDPPLHQIDEEAVAARTPEGWLEGWRDAAGEPSEDGA